MREPDIVRRPIAAFWTGESAATLGRLAAVLVLTGLGGAFALTRIDLSPEPASPVRPATLLPVALPPAPPPPATLVPDAGRWMRDLALGPERAGFQRVVRGGAEPICALLGASGWRMSGWEQSKLGKTRGECSGERRYPSAAKGRGSRLFAMLRGEAGGAPREIRLKLNLLDPATATLAAGEASDAVAALFGHLSWGLPADAARRIAALEPFETEAGGTRMRFWREAGETPRFNLHIDLPAARADGDPSRLRPLTAGERDRDAALLAALPSAEP